MSAKFSLPRNPLTAPRFEKQTAQAAFSLIEIMIALALATIVMVSLLGVFPLIQKALLNTSNETKSALIAQSVFATLRGQEFDDIDLYGLSINLETQNDEQLLYADIDLNITDARTADTAFLIRIQFNNNPSAYPTPAGSSTIINHVSMVIYWTPAEATYPDLSPNPNKAPYTGFVVASPAQI